MPKTTTTTKDDAAVLLYCGMLGHPYAVTCEGSTGGRSAAGECNDEATARRWAKERNNGRAFKKVKKGYLQLV